MHKSGKGWDTWARTVEGTWQEEITSQMGLLDGTVIQFMRALDSGDFLELDPTARIVHPHFITEGESNSRGMLVRKDAIIWVNERGGADAHSN